MAYFTDDELTSLAKMEAKLKRAALHSKEAVRLGRLIAEVHRQAHLRNNPPNIAIDQMMARLAQRLGVQ